MSIRKNIVLIILLLSCLQVLAHSGKARYHAIIETDASDNDVCAISMLLASKKVEVIGIYCTDEITDAREAEARVRTILTEYHHEGIPVGRSAKFLKQLYANEEEKITYVCLTSLRSVAHLVCQDPVLSRKTEQVIWYHNDLWSHERGLNHTLSPEDYKIVSSSGIKLIHLSNSLKGGHIPGKKLREKAAKINTRYTYSIPKTPLDLFLSKELAAFYLSDTTLFNEEESLMFPGHTVFRLAEPRNIVPLYLDLLREKEPDYKILSHIPLEEEYYQDDIAPYIDSVLLQHGESEFRAGVLCFEIHGHIGIYAIIGVKMGLRAREYFNIGLDDLNIISHTGQLPPYSCLIDGLQVSTGSSLGHGLIQSPEIKNPEIAATFRFKDQEILIRLKPEIVAQMKQDIKHCITEYGNLTPLYWQAVRELALVYWVELDRNQIFTIHTKK